MSDTNRSRRSSSLDSHRSLSDISDTSTVNSSHRNKSSGKISNWTNSTDPRYVRSRIFIGHLPTDDVTRPELEARYSAYGKLLGLSIHKGFAFVQYEREEDAQTAVKEQDGALFKGKVIEARMAVENGAKPFYKKRYPFPPKDYQKDSRGYKDYKDFKGYHKEHRDYREFKEFKDYRDRSPRRTSHDGSPSRRSHASSRRSLDSPHRSRSSRSPHSRNRSISPVRKFDDIKNAHVERPKDKEEEEAEKRKAQKDPYWNISTVHLAKYLPTPRPNDCEIIVLNKQQRSYAEHIEAQLKAHGLTIDLLFPHVETPISQVLDDISRRGCLYCIVVTPQNEVHYSITLNILYGSVQELD